MTRSQIGVSSFPRGKAYYRAIMDWYLSVDATPEQVHEMGKKEVARISKLMYEVGGTLVQK